MSKRRFAPRLAKTVHGGLRTQSVSRAAWWRRPLIAWLEDLHLGARLGRGRNYAQQGQVRSLSVSPGLLQAEIQGAEARPYHVSVTMPLLDTDRVWARLREAPFLTAQLAAHTLPMAFVECLRRDGMELFPQTRQDMAFSCDCKDWARPCKHIAAALCLFADAIAADPHLFLRFRGLLFPEVPPRLEAQRLSREALLALYPIADAAAIPRRLGTLPYWRGTEDFRKTLEGAYRRAHTKTLTALEAPVDLRLPVDIPPE